MGIAEKAYVASVIAGMLFAAGWWILADGAIYAVHHNDRQRIKAEWIVPGLIATMGLLMMNSFAWSDMTGGGLNESSQGKAKCLCFTSIVVIFACICGAVIIFVIHYAGDKPHDSDWPGVSILLSNIFVLLSAVVWRIGRAPQDDDGFGAM